MPKCSTHITVGLSRDGDELLVAMHLQCGVRVWRQQMSPDTARLVARLLLSAADDIGGGAATAHQRAECGEVS